RVEMTQLVMPGDANARGTAFGGKIMAWIDIAAAISAGRYARGPVVTASVDDVHFIRPIRQGDVVILKAQVNFVGRSSMEVGVRVEGEEWGGGEARYHALSAYTTFVALDGEGRPRPVAPLKPTSPDDARRCEDGGQRMVARRARRRHKAERLEQ
ncbi:MAG TPA: acyl-CoA thioesterase, partial [Deltaproteobacteria bacterium]|nr:acyl-CoA thioesterase [Deltaproteobacteria bacterium]